MPSLDAKDLRDKLASKKGFVWLKREITPEQQAAIYRLGLPGVGFLMENKRIYPNGPTLSHVLGSVNIDNQGIAGIEKYIDAKRGLSDLQALGYAASPDDLKPVQLSIDLQGPARHARRARAGHGAFQGQGGGRRDHGRQHRRDDLARLAARFRPQQSGRRARSQPHQPHQCRRLRDGLDLQGADHGDGHRIGPLHHQFDARCARRPCIMAASRSPTITPRSAC